MNKIIAPFLMSGFLMVVASGCNDAKTTANAPNSVDSNTAETNATNSTKSSGATPNSADSNGAMTTKQDTKDAKNDAQSDVRRQQLNSDIRAREQRNKIGGDEQKRDDGDLESEVRNKLEANIPNGQLTVDAKDGSVTVAGTVQNQAQLKKIEPLAKEIKGVGNVTVKAIVAEAKAK